jgi:hypothetical protein
MRDRGVRNKDKEKYHDMGIPHVYDIQKKTYYQFPEREIYNRKTQSTITPLIPVC